MTGIEVSIEREEIQRLLRDDRGLAELVERVLNRVLEAEITEHVGAGPHERTPERRGRRDMMIEDEGPSVPLVARVVDDTLPEALLRQLGLFTRVVGVEAAGRRVSSGAGAPDGSARAVLIRGYAGRGT